MCYLRPKTQTPDSFSHISHQEQEKKEWEQLEETHRSWNLVFPVIFELAAAGIRRARRILKRNAGSEELVKKKGRERRMKERMFTLTMKLGRCAPSPPPNATDSCGRRKRKRRNKEEGEMRGLSSRERQMEMNE